MPPRMSATANEVNQAIVDADSHGESGFLHFCQVLPGIFGWVIPEKIEYLQPGRSNRVLSAKRACAHLSMVPPMSMPTQPPNAYT